MKKLDVIKLVANAVVGAGVGKTVDLVLKNNLPTDMDWKVRLATFIGTTAIGSYISAKCGEHVENEIDKVAEVVENVKNGVKQIEESEAIDIVE